MTHRYRSPLRPLDYGWARSAARETGLADPDPVWDETTIGEWTPASIYAFRNPLPERFVKHWDLEDLDAVKPAFEQFALFTNAKAFALEAIVVDIYTFVRVEVNIDEGEGVEDYGAFVRYVTKAANGADVYVYGRQAAADFWADLKADGDEAQWGTSLASTCIYPNTQARGLTRGDEVWGPALEIAVRAARRILKEARPS